LNALPDKDFFNRLLGYGGVVHKGSLDSAPIPRKGAIAQ